jgi:mitochondrial fission protein ELM1
MRKVHQKFMIGVRLFEEGQTAQALALAEELIRSEDEMDRLDGYLCRAPNAVASLHLARYPEEEGVFPVPQVP